MRTFIILLLLLVAGCGQSEKEKSLHGRIICVDGKQYLIRDQLGDTFFLIDIKGVCK